MPGTLASIGTSASSNTTSSLAVSGVASGYNWQNTVQQLAQAERGSETLWQNQQTRIAAQKAAYNTITSNLATLQTDVQTLMDPAFFNSRTTSSSTATVATAAAAAGATLGNFSLNISQLATSARMAGAAGISQRLIPSGNPGAATVGTAGFATPVTAGTFTVNGAQVSIAATDSFQAIFDRVASATNNGVSMSYDADTDKISISSSDSSPIVLGSATDTSNFLQAAQLFNNGGGGVTSTSALGRVNVTAGMGSADTLIPISEGSGGGGGAFSINGVTVNFSATNDSIQNVLDRINNAGAGVTASYDSVGNRFNLVNNTTGDTGIALQDVRGNFLAATGLSGGTLNRGSNLIYTLGDGGQPLTSQSNTITAANSGLSGLTITALATGTTKIGVAADTSTMSTAIQKLVTDYNTAQGFIATQQKVTTTNDKVTPGTLTGDSYTVGIAATLRSLMNQITSIAGTSGSVKSLADLGFKANGKDNTIALSDSTKLASALAGNLGDVKALFSDPTSGMGKLMDKYVTKTTGIDGTLTSHLSALATQSDNISTQISNLENKIAQDTANWNTEFQNLETATAKSNQELSYLSQSFK